MVTINWNFKHKTGENGSNFFYTDVGPEGKENTFSLGIYLKIDKKIKFETTVWYLTGVFGVYITMQSLTLGRRSTCWMLCKLVSPKVDN